MKKIAYIVYMKGHRNSKGELAPWVIKSHETGKIISSHKTKAEAKRHLKRMQYFKHKKAFLSDFKVDISQMSNVDIQALRKSIIAEYDAVNLYEQLADIVSDELKQLFLDIAKEEKTHIKEFEYVLKELDKEQNISEIEAIKEIKKIRENEPLKESLDYGSKVASKEFKFDPNSTKNEGRFRLLDPDKFKPDTFRRYQFWAGVKAPKGVSFIVGELKENGKKALQAIRFNKKFWDEKKASKFWEKVKNLPGFEKEWTWEKKFFISVYDAFKKASSLLKDEKEENDLEYVFLDDDIDYSELEDLKNSNFIIFDFYGTNPDLMDEKIKNVLNKIKSYFNDNRVLGIIWRIPNNCKFEKGKMKRFFELINSGFYNFIDIQNEEWYNEDVIHEMAETKSNFLRKNFKIGEGTSDLDLYKFEIKNEKDLEKFKNFLENIEQQNYNNKAILVKYIGVDPKISNSLEEIVKKFKERYLDYYDLKYGYSNPSNVQRTSPIDDKEDIKEYFKPTPQSAYDEDYIAVMYPNKIDYTY